MVSLVVGFAVLLFFMIVLYLGSVHSEVASTYPDLMSFFQCDWLVATCSQRPVQHINRVSNLSCESPLKSRWSPWLLF